ncbi:SGNH/GDSL hydrolase family protein [Terriglobus aquaticus]|uniref:SGNH/GDSL hydrolase family protein n=1 Tax=Terriglobus aquaticus TaxID=940139 RepID=A0ABW9KKG8_9BACT|nr:SGNH/GDSL hydrolase family protein [Terriglobus aquaticus]
MKKLFYAALCAVSLFAPLANTQAQQSIAYLSDLTTSLKMQGNYNSSTAYIKNDVVVSSGSAYYALQNTTGNAPSNTSSYWALLSSSQSSGSSLSYQGAYSGSTTYANGAIVTYSGSSWVSLQSANTGNTPANGSSYWGLLAAQGAPGSGASGQIAEAQLPAQFNSVHRFLMGPRLSSGAKGLTTYGDSITACTGATGNSTCYANILAAKLGLTLTNNGASGYQSEDIAFAYAFADKPTSAANPVRTYFALHNDLHWCGNTTGCLANARSALTATFSYLTTPTGNKVPGSGFTTTGTWMTYTDHSTGGIFSTTQNSTASTTVTTTAANQPVYVWYLGRDGDGGTATLSVDGSVVDTLYTASQTGQCFCTKVGSTVSVQAKRYVLSAAGSHTLLFTVTSPNGTGSQTAGAATQTNNFVLYGVGQAKTPLPVASPASLFVYAPIYENGMNISAATDAYAGMESSVVSSLQADGLLVNFTNTNAYMNNAVDMSGSATTVPAGEGAPGYSGTSCPAVPAGSVGQHPNDCGHMHIAEAMAADIQ